jgi:hypothetical protein
MTSTTFFLAFGSLNKKNSSLNLNKLELFFLVELYMKGWREQVKMLITLQDGHDQMVPLCNPWEKHAIFGV